MDEPVKWHNVPYCYDQNPLILVECLLTFDLIDPFPYETDVCLLAGFSNLYPIKFPLYF